MKTRIAIAVAVLAVAACTNTHTAAPASPTNPSAPPPPLGPSSALANINLPDGSTLVKSTTQDVNPSAPSGPGSWWQSDESWHYTVSYDTAVAVMSSQLASAVRLNDGAWINRCQALVTSEYHDWLFVGDGVSIMVLVYRPESKGGARIDITYENPTMASDVGGCTG